MLTYDQNFLTCLNLPPIVNNGYKICLNDIQCKQYVYANDKFRYKRTPVL